MNMKLNMVVIVDICGVVGSVDIVDIRCIDGVRCIAGSDHDILKNAASKAIARLGTIHV